MKKFGFLAALAVLFSFVSCANADELKVMSYNIRLDHKGDLDKQMLSARKVAKVTDNMSTFNGWGKRKPEDEYAAVC